MFTALSSGCSRVPSPLTPAFHGSVGLPYHGVLTEAVALPQRGEGFVRIKPPGAQYGIRELVDTVTYAAKTVHTHHPLDPPVLIGDLSLARGGEIPHHASHRSGRDVDFIFFATDLGGAPIQSPGWIRYGADGIGLAHSGVGGRVYVRFDVAKNWELAKTLIESPYAQVMWLFVSNPLKSLLIEYAVAKGEDPELIWEAENILHQPTNSLPHNDHFHMRIVCPDRLGPAGCEPGGPVWPWLAPAESFHWPEDEDELAHVLEVDSFPPLSAGEGR
jgi:penicillin-insensitive murein endopeptidase